MVYYSRKLFTTRTRRCKLHIRGVFDGFRQGEILVYILL